MSQTRVGVGVVVQRSDGRVLVGRRLAEPGRPLAIPGGKLDPGESVEACAVRELAEETGIALDVEAATTFAAVLVDGWVVPGVRIAVDDDVEPEVREPDKFGDFAWMTPGAVVGGGAAFPATVALLEALGA
jgi:ADP-ribose pyrophosphatase YjhB (NUDIX family)